MKIHDLWYRRLKSLSIPNIVLVFSRRAHSFEAARKRKETQGYSSLGKVNGPDPIGIFDRQSKVESKNLEWILGRGEGRERFCPGWL